MRLFSALLLVGAGIVQPATAQISGYTLSASPATVAPDGTLTVSWTAPAGRPSSDWVALYRVGDPDGDSYLWYTYTDGTLSGSASTSAPSPTGQYEFRYFLENGYDRAASSNTVTVGTGGSAPTVNISSPGDGATFPAPANITINATASVTGGSITRVEFFQGSTLLGEETTGPYTFVWSSVPAGSYSLTARATSDTGATTTSSAVNITVNGASPTYTLVASPTTVAPGGILTVTWTAPPGRPSSDWVALYRVGDPDDANLWYTYTGGTTSGSSSATAPSETGQYDFRYFLEDGYDRATTSNQVTVVGVVSGPAAIGQWGSAFTWGIYGGLNALHMMVLPNKRVLSWPLSKYASEPQLWNPGAGFALVPVPSQVYRQEEDDVFCSGHVVLPSGQLLVTGGQQSVNGLGIPTSFLFDFETNTWTRSGDMGGPGRDGRRWYPTTIMLPSGDVLAVAGSTDGNILDEDSLTVNNYPEVYSGGVWSPRNPAPDTQGYDVFYPWLHVVPDGKVFYSGPQPSTRSLDPVNGDLAEVDGTEFGQHRYWGTSVMYEPGKVLIVGGTTNYFYSDGTDLPTNTAEVIDLNQLSPTWRYTGTAMARGRKHHNAVLLPDGQVLIVGGTNCPPWHSVEQDGSGNVTVPELWNPASEEFTPMAPLTATIDGSPGARLRTRAYHSTAVLLADGQVLVAGGDWASYEPPNGEAPLDEPTHEDAQIFRPPYLFNANGTAAARPTMSAPAERSSFGYNARVDITTGASQAPDIATVNLVGLSSVTHGFNMGQRFVSLRFTGGRTSNTLSVLTPASPNECPPGYYLLFILRPNPLNDNRLVPSASRIIRIQ